MKKPPGTEQQSHWSRVYAGTAQFFGEGPSGFARQAAESLRGEGVTSLLELGFGQGRDTLFFAGQGFRVTALDYSDAAVAEVTAAARAAGLADRVRAAVHDVRRPLPFADASFDACYSHMLLCMELTEAEISTALGEIRRVLRPGGLALYSVRSDHDPHYRQGAHLGEELYEIGGFVVHFFTDAKIRRLARGFDLLAVERLQEGSLPRDLYAVSLRRHAGTLLIREEEPVTRPMDKFQEFFDATHQPGVLDARTKGLLFLTASLAAGCEL